MRVYDWLILGVVILWAVIGVAIAYRKRKKGHGCSGNCADCNGC